MRALRPSRDDQNQAQNPTPERWHRTPACPARQCGHTGFQSEGARPQPDLSQLLCSRGGRRARGWLLAAGVEVVGGETEGDREGGALVAGGRGAWLLPTALVCANGADPADVLMC